MYISPTGRAFDLAGSRVIRYPPQQMEAYVVWVSEAVFNVVADAVPTLLTS